MGEAQQRTIFYLKLVGSSCTSISLCGDKHSVQRRASCGKICVHLVDHAKLVVNVHLMRENPHGRSSAKVSKASRCQQAKSKRPARLSFQRVDRLSRCVFQKLSNNGIFLVIENQQHTFKVTQKINRQSKVFVENLKKPIAAVAAMYHVLEASGENGTNKIKKKARKGTCFRHFKDLFGS